jgi:hypothetical protein
MKYFFAQVALVIFLMGIIVGCGKSVDGQLSLQLVSGCDSAEYDALVSDINMYCIIVGSNRLCRNQLDQIQLPVDVNKLTEAGGSGATVQMIVRGFTKNLPNTAKVQGISAPVTLDPNMKDVTVPVPFFRLVTLPSPQPSGFTWGGDEFMTIANNSPVTCSKLPFAAQGHTAVSFDKGSGHVLVVGTSSQDTLTASAFLIDFYALGFLPINNTSALHRTNHTTSLLSDGRVVVIGGCGYLQSPMDCTANPKKDIVIIDGAKMTQPYNPKEDYGSLTVTNLADKTVGYFSHNAAVLQGNQILVNDFRNSPLLISGAGINLTTSPITVTSADDPFIPFTTTAAVLPTDELEYDSLMYGSAAAPATVDLLKQTASTSFTILNSALALATRTNPIGVKITTYTALFFGGLPDGSTAPQVIYIESDANGTNWKSCPIPTTTTTAIGFPTKGYTVTKLSNGYIFVAGGNSTPVGSTYYLVQNSNFPTCAATGNFTIYSGPKMRMPRTGHTASLLPDGRLILVGGTSASTANPKVPLDEVVASSAEVITFNLPQ